MKALFLIIFVSTIALTGFSAKAQESSPADPLSDYSYLWDKEKKEKPVKQNKPKKEKSSPQPAPAVADTLPPSGPDESPQEADAELVEEGRELASVSEDFRAGPPQSTPGLVLTGGFTYTKIGNEQFAGLILSPEFKIWKIGVGLNIPLLYGLDSKSFRTEIFKGGVGIARVIRYIKYGSQKSDPVYVRVGELDNTMIGFGGLVNNYTNTTSYERRKIGLHYDINYRGLVGLEGLYSDFNVASLNLLAVRPYVRPLGWTMVPVARTLELGFTYVTDKDQTNQSSDDNKPSTYFFTSKGVEAYGFDAGINVLKIPFISIDAYFNYSQLSITNPALVAFINGIYAEEGTERKFRSGRGISGGFNFRFNFIADLLSTDLRIERLSYTANYLPQFFDATYELNKDAKLFMLADAGKMDGIYGSLTGHLLNKVQLGGSLLLPDKPTESTPAVVKLHADLERLADKVSLHGSYIKGNLATLKDAFKLDENSLVKLRAIYHITSFFAAGIDYYWAFTPTSDGAYKTTSYMSPYIGISLKL